MRSEQPLTENICFYDLGPEDRIEKNEGSTYLHRGISSGDLVFVMYVIIFHRICRIYLLVFVDLVFVVFLSVFALAVIVFVKYGVGICKITGNGNFDFIVLPPQF